MIEINDVKKNSKLLIDGIPFAVVDFEHVKPGKGSAFSRCRLKNLKTGQLLERTFKSSEKYPEPNIEHKSMQYLYPDGEMFTFMDNENYEQLTLGAEFFGDQAKFLKENMPVNVMFFDEKPVSIEIPIFVELAILYTEPGFKGDTATGSQKPAKLQGGHTVNVPLHLKEGDILKIDTRTGEYVEKINK